MIWWALWKGGLYHITQLPKAFVGLPLFKKRHKRLFFARAELWLVGPHYYLLLCLHCLSVCLSLSRTGCWVQMDLMLLSSSIKVSSSLSLFHPPPPPPPPPPAFFFLVENMPGSLFPDKVQTYGCFYCALTKSHAECLVATFACLQREIMYMLCVGCIMETVILKSFKVSMTMNSA